MIFWDNQNQYCNYFGQQFYPSITLVFNNQVMLRKIFKWMQYQSSKCWVAEIVGDVKTSEVNQYTGLQQISQLIDADFSQRGNYWDAGS